MTTLETCIMLCPQCEGEGSYADGLDEAACTTTCTRCKSNGWIVDVKAIAGILPGPAEREAVEHVALGIYNHDDVWSGVFLWPDLPELGRADGYREAAKAAITVYKQFIEQTG